MLEFLIVTVYFSGVINCFSQLIFRLNENFPTLEYSFSLKIAILIVCCFSWLGLFFVLSNDELNS